MSMAKALNDAIAELERGCPYCQSQLMWSGPVTFRQRALAIKALAVLKYSELQSLQSVGRDEVGQGDADSKS